jgi:hypothetical protein
MNGSPASVLILSRRICFDESQINSQYFKSRENRMSLQILPTVREGPEMNRKGWKNYDGDSSPAK